MENSGYFKDKYRIDSIRLPFWDYSRNGDYFITICVKDGIYHFGDVISSKMHLTKIGYAAKIFWRQIPKHFPFVKLDAHIVMPNHIHGILRLKNKKVSLVETQDFASPRRKQGAETQDLASLQGFPNKFGPQSKNLASIIRGFKIGVTKFAKNNNIDFAWQERFYDHIIQDEEALYNIRQYIKNNPINWESGRNYKELPIKNYHKKLPMQPIDKNKNPC